MGTALRVIRYIVSPRYRRWVKVNEGWHVLFRVCSYLAMHEPVDHSRLDAARIVNALMKTCVKEMYG